MDMISLVTCCQLRTESLPIFYSDNKFYLLSYCCTFDCHDDSYTVRICASSSPSQRLPLEWLGAIGYDNLRHIRTLLITGHAADSVFVITLRQNAERRTLKADGGKSRNDEGVSTGRDSYKVSVVDLPNQGLNIVL